MKESVTIRNFGPIKEACIEDLRPLTILIGESGSGKSTILKVVALFRYIYKMLNIRFYLKSSQIDRSPFRIRLNDYFKTNALDQYVRSDSEIIYTVKFESFYFWKIIIYCRDKIHHIYGVTSIINVVK